MFENIRFIRSSAKNDASGKTYAPMFRRKFVIEKPFASATLSVCGLGYGYSYINGKTSRRTCSPRLSATTARPGGTWSTM